MSDRMLNLTEVITACRQGKQLPPHILLGLTSADATPAVVREAYEKRATMVREMLADVASAGLRERLLRQLSVARQLVIGKTPKSRTGAIASDQKNDADDLHFAEIDEPEKDVVRPKSAPPAVPSRSKMPPVPVAPVNTSQNDNKRQLAMLRTLVAAPVVLVLLLLVIQPWRSTELVSSSGEASTSQASVPPPENAPQPQPIPEVEATQNSFVDPIKPSVASVDKNPEISSLDNKMDSGGSVFDDPPPLDLGENAAEARPAESLPGRRSGTPKVSPNTSSRPTLVSKNILPDVCHLRPPGSPPQQFLLERKIETSQERPNLTLELDDSVADLAGRYHLQLAKKPEESHAWQVFLRKSETVNGASKSTLLTEQGFDLDLPLAEFQLSNENLDFRWMPGAKPKIARQLSNCLLRINDAEFSQSVPLRKIEEIPEIPIPGKAFSYSLDWLHNDSMPPEEKLFIAVSFRSQSGSSDFSDVQFPANRTVVIPLTRIDSLEASLKNEANAWKLRLYHNSDSAILKSATQEVKVAEARFLLRQGSSSAEKQLSDAEALLEELREMADSVSSTKLRFRVFASLDGGQTEKLTLGAYK